jgi:hypothetical protein
MFKSIYTTTSAGSEFTTTKVHRLPRAIEACRRRQFFTPRILQIAATDSDSTAITFFHDFPSVALNAVFLNHVMDHKKTDRRIPPHGDTPCM